MATFKSFFERMNVMILVVVASIVTLISCDKADVGDEVGRHTTDYDASYKETSKLSTDDTYGTATLAITSEKFYGETSQGKLNGEAQAKCTVSVESDPVETAHKEAKTYTVGDLQTTTANGNTIVTCDIVVFGNGQENVLKTRTVIEPTQVWDQNYTLKLKSVKVDEKNVRMTETTKKSGESGRQALSIPVVFSFASEGSKEAHEGNVTLNAAYEQFQKESTPVIDHEEISGHTWKLNPDFSIDYMIIVKQIWTGDKEPTYVEYPWASSVIFNVIDHEDLTVKSWAYGLKQIEGLTVGTPYTKETGNEFFKEKRREDLYSTIHGNGQDKDIKCVYSCDHPEVTFTKGDLTYTFNFVSPSFSEISDDLLDGTSMKSGYDLKIFRNSVNAKYGNADGGIQEKVLEERCNLYKQAKAVADVEFSNKKKSYSFGAIQYDVDCIDVYNDGTKSEKYHVTTSRPWNLTYQGPWSMSTDKDVTEVCDQIKVSKTKSYDPEVQNISNGSWSCTMADFDVKNNTTVAGTSKENYWKSEKFPVHMILTLHGKPCDFGEDMPTGSHANDKIVKNESQSTATSEVYNFSEDLNFVVGTYTHTSQATGTVTKAVEVTVTSWEWNAKQWVEGKNVKAFVERIYHMSDGSTKTVRREFTGTIGSNVYTYFETTETSNQESTGAAQFILVNTEHKTDGDWAFDYSNSKLNFGVTYAGSEQTDGWNIYVYNNLSCTIDGETYTFPALDMSATANSTQTKKSEDENKTTYEHSNAATFYFGGSAINLDAAKGLIFVNKVVTPEHHDGFFPESYGKLEGDNKAACRNPHNQKDWGIGGSLKFTNGSLPYFISKDGIIEFGEFEKGSTVWNASSPDANSGKILNCNAKDASTAMKWVRDVTINMLSYSDGTLMGFNDGHNTVSTSKFPGTISQHDGGKWQDISFAGVKDASGRTSFDTSF
jgi:hypothetical protein